jgi:hypothetical protein
MAIDRNIVVRLNAILTIAITTMGREKLPLFPESIFPAMKYSVFNAEVIVAKVRKCNFTTFGTPTTW